MGRVSRGSVGTPPQLGERERTCHVLVLQAGESAAESVNWRSRVVAAMGGTRSSAASVQRLIQQQQQLRRQKRLASSSSSTTVLVNFAVLLFLLLYSRRCCGEVLASIPGDESSSF
ncbi:hypothetical protein CY35_12G056500 [Sphagnum magellanicum]|nr:hypothetical protein CY35_12G056500 [Sphagnum magellanicum]